MSELPMEWKYWLMDAATRCCSAADRHGRKSEQYREACERRDQVRDALKYLDPEPEQLALGVNA